MVGSWFASPSSLNPGSHPCHQAEDPSNYTNKFKKTEHHCWGLCAWNPKQGPPSVLQSKWKQWQRIAWHAIGESSFKVHGDSEDIWLEICIAISLGNRGRSLLLLQIKRTICLIFFYKRTICLIVLLWCPRVTINRSTYITYLIPSLHWSLHNKEEVEPKPECLWW